MNSRLFTYRGTNHYAKKKGREMNVRGQYVKQDFIKETTGWSQFMVKPYDKIAPEYLSGGYVRVKGVYSVSLKGLLLEMEGAWAQDPKGWYLNADKIEESAYDKELLSEFLIELSEGKIKNGHLEKLFMFGYKDFFVKICSPDYEEFCRSCGLPVIATVRTIECIRDAINERRTLNYLKQYKGNLTNVRNLLRVASEDPIEAIKKDPYGICEKAHIQFRIADRIGLDNGTNPISESRLKALTMHALKSRENEGNTCSTLEDITSDIQKYVGQEHALSLPTVAACIHDAKSIVQDRGYYYTSYLLRDEKRFAKEILRLNQSAVQIPFHEEYITSIEAELGVKYSKHQKEAFKLLAQTGVKILTGGPGTGKTTTVNGMLRYLEMVDDEVSGINLSKMSLAALSGKASQRMSEATKREASTVHKLLNYQPFGMDVYYKDENDPLEANVIVIDEVSMLDLPLAAKLLAAVQNGSLVLFVGDIDQLQSVGPGAILSDMLKSGCLSKCMLTEIHRQKGDSVIPRNSRKIIEGDLSLEQSNDFVMISADVTSGKTASEIACCIVQELLSYNIKEDDIQVLSPIRKEEGGTSDLNNELQELMNPDFLAVEDPLIYRGVKYTPGDRIMMRSNNYQKGYYNGDVGKVVSTKGQYMMTVRIGDEEIELTKDLFEDIDLAYCCTIHKSQGSEYPYTVIVLPDKAGHMMDSSLLYTAVTRAKKAVYIVYDGEMLTKSVITQRKDARHTLLSDRIKEEYGIAGTR